MSKAVGDGSIPSCATIYGEMAELAIALVLKTRDRKVMGDRDPLSPPFKDTHSNYTYHGLFWFDSKKLMQECCMQ